MKRPLASLIVFSCLLLVGLSGALGSRAVEVTSASNGALDPDPSSLANQDQVIIEPRPDETGSDPDLPPGTEGELIEELICGCATNTRRCAAAL